MEQGCIVLDFGSQYTQLIARRIREWKVFSEILPYNAPVKDITERQPKGIVLSGGPANVYERDAPFPDKEIFELGIPVLGICYGLQVIAHIFGGEVQQVEKREFGRANLTLIDKSDLFKDLEDNLTVWMSHGDGLTKLPFGFKVIGKTDNSSLAAISAPERRLFGLQFHPEVVHTPKGAEILKNFLFEICGCKPNWTMESFLERSIETIRARVGEKRVILGLSGGVDSFVTGVLIHRAIGDALTCIFVDNGLLRKGEASQVVEVFAKRLNIPLRVLVAKERFLKKLLGVTDPEEKRRIIGHEFVRLFEEEAEKIGDVHFLAQGTLYPDLIESRSVWGPSARIKTHHNVGGIPVEIELELLEPLKELFKDEVRILGEKLGLPEEIIWRQPFPGPGLAVRILGEITEERLNLLREADAIFQEEIIKSGLWREIWQYFVVLLPVKTVGVMGDQRTYEQAVVLRAVESRDGMTADWFRLPYELLSRISNRIINEIKGINRVVYDISSKPPATIEWE